MAQVLARCCRLVAGSGGAGHRAGTEAAANFSGSISVEHVRNVLACLNELGHVRQAQTSLQLTQAPKADTVRAL